MAKIIIIGAGISGLSTYLFLRKHLVLYNPSPAARAEERQEYEIKIYEAHDIHQSHFNVSLANAAASYNSDDESTTNALSANGVDPIFTPQAIGAAIGIARNGLDVLARLDETEGQQANIQDQPSCSLIEEMAVQGHPIEQWELSTARGFRLGVVELARPGNTAARSSLDDHKQSRAAGTAGRNSCPYHGIMIARQSCWEILRDRVLRVASDVIIRKKVVDVIIGHEQARNIVKFEDGSEEEADLVIGADGLRSVVRRAMFRKGEDEGRGEGVHTTATDGALNAREREPNSQTRAGWLRTILSYIRVPFFTFGGHANQKDTDTDYISPHYEGLVGVGGFVPSSVLQATGHKPGSMTVVFGPNGFFGYGYLTSSSASLSPSPTSLSNEGTDTETPPLAIDLNLPIPAPGPLAGWWSTCSSPDPFPYSTPSSRIPTSSAGNVPDTYTSTSTGTSADTDKDIEPRTTRKATDFNKQLALTALLDRHRTWHNPAIQAILSFVQHDTEQQLQQQQPGQDQGHIQDRDAKHQIQNNHNHNHNGFLTGKALDAAYPTWTTPELPYWSLRGRAVLVGDAAHALQPSSGQGASQALEDAEALALSLREHYLAATMTATAAPNPNPNSNPNPSSHTDTRPNPKPGTDTDTDTTGPSLTTALRAFETSRMPRVHAVHARAQRTSRMKADMGILAEWAMYAAIYLGLLFRSNE
ncbi:hypothetical protein AYO21_04536 [Fonsecaea monophora]|uniref:FAD-binding domain-containing protein n=1 Tax=Fonsecaea monophora TaxID=254056 RepID=A0A177FBE2_9EURO|nr:hypothetical protein AYO21_04536 [Fonsecaea monophora]KAH0837075.1 hypothetical protein FOPE_04585 [Fonsecaea pedrosoi]OAG41156.1 hypothetical protein AYO21_04536 [Fonsecaea monophora]